jgi:precorrin-2 dehydrogenase/sirohydrochlorin ferrochelatase
MNELQPSGAFPVNLLLADRPCLVVGGGKVAARKIRHLIDAGARITVISPEVCDEVAGWIEEQRVTHLKRVFEPGDTVGSALVFAATNDRFINRQVLDDARKHNALCSCVDGHWAQSDFTTPAITRHGSVMLTVSTGGQSCRQAKLIKDSLAKHMAMVETADLVVVGTDHHHMDIEEREPFHLTGPRFDRTGWMIMQLWGIHEFMILNTCNRVEVVAVASKETSTNGILRHILGFDRLKEDKFYLKHGAAAFEHLCMVSAGMLSQTPGESHIAAQIKEALAEAQRRGWAGSMMQEWVSSLLHVSKHIQTEVAPLLRSEEIEDLVLTYLQAQIPDLSAKTVMVLGAGMIGQGLVRNAVPKAGEIIWCYHLNCPELSGELKNKVELCTFNSIKDRLGEADIIISATEAPGHVLHSGHAPFLDQEKKIVLVDLGMPRNIDPALAGLSPEISLIDLDGLKRWHRRENPEMEDIFNQCSRIIGNHQEQYERIIKSFQGGNAQ